MVGPLERLRHSAIVVSDERQNLVAKIVCREEVSPFEQLAYQDAEPDFDLIHPQRVFRRVGEHDAMGGIVQEGGIYITVPGMCKAMGLAANTQIRRMINTNKLRIRLRTLTLITRGGPQKVTCLNAKTVAFWLIGIESSKSKPAFQRKIDEYHDRIEGVAEGVFADVMGVQLSTPGDIGIAAPIDPRLIQLAEKYDQITAIADFIWDNRNAILTILRDIPTMRLQMDDFKLLLERVIDEQAALKDQVIKIDERIQGLIPAQEREMHDYVNALVKDGQKLPTPLTHDFVWGRLKHRFNVASYSDIPDTRFDAAMQYLRDLRAKIFGSGQMEQGGLFES